MAEGVLDHLPDHLPVHHLHRVPDRQGQWDAERQRTAYAEAKAASDEYIRSVAGASPTQQVADAKALLDSGAITPQEFEALKAKALG